jgi:hypothetical protein
MFRNGKTTPLTAAALLLSGLSFAWWATSTAARAEETAVPKHGVYPNVQDLPPKPEKPGMTVDKQVKLKKELNDARDH